MRSCSIGRDEHAVLSVVGFAEQAHKPIAERHGLDSVAFFPQRPGSLRGERGSTIFDVRVRWEI